MFALDFIDLLFLFFFHFYSFRFNSLFSLQLLERKAYIIYFQAFYFPVQAFNVINEFLILEEKLSQLFIAEYNVNCGLAIYDLYYVDIGFPVPIWIKIFFNHKWMLNFVRSFFI